MNSVYAAKARTSGRASPQILDAFNARYGTDFRPDGFLQGERTSADIPRREIREKLPNNAPDVSWSTYRRAFMMPLIWVFQGDKSLQNTLRSDPDAREDMTRFAFAPYAMSAKAVLPLPDRRTRRRIPERLTSICGKGRRQTTTR